MTLCIDFKGIYVGKLQFWNIPDESIGLKFIPSQSELFRFIPISVSKPMWIIPNQSEKRFVSRLMKNGQKSIRLNPINSETSIRMNPNQSETKFSIRINPISDWSKLNFQSELIWIVPTSNSFVFDHFSSNETQNVFRIGLEWFALARIQIPEWIGIVLIDSEWISIQYFRQGGCITL